MTTPKKKQMSRTSHRKSSIVSYTTKTKRLWFLPLLTVLVGAATVAAFLVGGIRKAWEDQEAAFQESAQGIVMQIQRDWKDYVRAASWIHSYCREKRLDMTHTEFQHVYEYVKAGGLVLQSAQFVPNVTRDERQGVEDEARQYYAENYPNVTYGGFVGLDETKGDASLEPRSEQDFYFPVDYVEPVIGNEHAIDLDFLSSPSRREAVMFCMKTGLPALTERIKLVQETEQAAFGVVLMHPGVNLTTQPDVWPRDLASIVIRVNDVLMLSAQAQASSSSVYIYDATNSSASPLFLGGIQVEGNLGETIRKFTFLPEIELEDLPKSDRLYLQDELSVADRVWTVSVVAQEGSFQPKTLFVKLAGSIVFLVTLLLAVRVYVDRRKVEKANRRAHRLLLNVLPEETALRLAKNPSHVADHFESTSVLFADLVGFTNMSSNMPAVKVVELLNDLFSRFDNLLDKYGLNKIKTIGDCYMVATVPGCFDPDVNSRAVCMFALDMMDAIRERNLAFPENPLDLRIGINCGPVVAGVVGHKRFLYDLWGDTVNIASRFESCGVPGKIQVTKNIVASLPEGEFHLERRGMVHVKGIGEMEAFFLSKMPIGEAPPVSIPVGVEQPKLPESRKDDMA